MGKLFVMAITNKRLVLRTYKQPTYKQPVETLLKKIKQFLKNGKRFEEVLHKRVIPNGQWIHENTFQLLVIKEM